MSRVLHLIGAWVLAVVVGTAAFGTAIAVRTEKSFASDLAQKEHILRRNETGLVLLDRANRPFFSFYEAQKKTFVPLSQIPKHVQQAVIAVEDKNFYSHRGFSVRAIARSMVHNIYYGTLSYGGSTITQQLAKNTLLHSRKSVFRKYQEIILARQLERRYSKDDILELYLNSVYFGEGAFGIEAAAQTYFNTPTNSLTLAEGSLLAALLPAPSRLSPISGDRNSAEARQKLVLRKMAEQNYISTDEQSRTEHSPLIFAQRQHPDRTHAAHFALMIRQALVQKFGEETIAQSGYRVKTTIDLDWQMHAERALKEHVESLHRHGVTNGAVVVLDPSTGEILSLVGSTAWEEPGFGKINMALVPRQPGSSFKPIAYATALEHRVITPATVLHDIPTTYGRNYRPMNFDKRFRGSVLARQALATSLNVPSVEVMSRTGVPAVLATAQRLGISTLRDSSKYGLSLVLGAGEVPLVEMTNAYATFANNGQRQELLSILEIRNKYGEIVYTASPKTEQAVSPEVAFQISSMLSDVRARAPVFGNFLTISRPTAVKTGTSEDYRDAWTLGYTPSLAIGIWIGNSDNTPMDHIAGALGAAPVWRNLMERFLDGTPREQFVPPSSLRIASICPWNGLLATDGNSGYREYFLAGTQPTHMCVPKPLEEKAESEVADSQESNPWKENGGRGDKKEENGEDVET